MMFENPGFLAFYIILMIAMIVIAIMGEGHYRKVLDCDARDFAHAGGERVPYYIAKFRYYSIGAVIVFLGLIAAPMLIAATPLNVLKDVGEFGICVAVSGLLVLWVMFIRNTYSESAALGLALSLMSLLFSSVFVIVLIK